MEYGLIKDTTMAALADGFRDKGIIPKTQKETIYVDYTAIYHCATSETDPMFSSAEDRLTTAGNNSDYGYFVSIPGAASLKFEVRTGRQGSGGGAPNGYLYFYNSNHSYVTSTSLYYYASDPVYEEFSVTVSGSAGSIRMHYNGSGATYGFIAHVYPLDADGNEIPGIIPKEIDVPKTVLPEEMVEAITNAPTLPPESAFTVTGNCNYRFAYDGWSWFLKAYGDNITTSDITSLNYAFTDAKKVEEIPFTLNVTNCTTMAYAFSGMNALTKCPKIRGTLKSETSLSMEKILQLTRITDAEELFEPEMLEAFKNYKVTSAYSTPRMNGIFGNAYGISRVPSWFYTLGINEESTAFPSASYTLYNNLAYYTYNLGEFLNIPVLRCKAAQTSNMFSNTLTYACRLKDFTFETDNGQPKVTEWKSQVIDFTGSTAIGCGINVGVMKNYCGDKEVKDDATYQAFKNDPDWWTVFLPYCRYNHDSAVNTINSLPDTSTYLASAGGTNTIKFKKAAGSKTDGGAIETLTAEEIAVAAAKGWTVTLV